MLSYGTRTSIVPAFLRKGERMNRNEFLEQLRKTKKTFHWSLTTDGEIKGRWATFLYTPITAVARSLDKGDFRPWEFEKAGRAIELLEEEQHEIMLATGPAGATFTDDLALRAKLLAVLELTENMDFTRFNLRDRGLVFNCTVSDPPALADASL